MMLSLTCLLSRAQVPLTTPLELHKSKIMSVARRTNDSVAMRYLVFHSDKKGGGEGMAERYGKLLGSRLCQRRTKTTALAGEKVPQLGRDRFVHRPA